MKIEIATTKIEGVSLGLLISKKRDINGDVEAEQVAFASSKLEYLRMKPPFYAANTRVLYNICTNYCFAGTFSR
ncbi:hypothetical protein WH47_02471 [Habropoda laboriosa]|uniref:Uncharacterized protein n=1 Tax=Habropoda laboriosa TaxID=597456 RepID=A0A0L7QWN4_9HYME|nr:hypothetical protein WH47_02471 [Habropoda laboriosa]